MRVQSPIGDLPFTVRAIRVEGRSLVVEGELGAWRSRIYVSAADAPMIARAAWRPIVVAAALGVAAAALRSRR